MSKTEKVKSKESTKEEDDHEITVTPKKIVIPKSGRLAIEIKPTARFHAVKFVIVTLNSMLFEIEKCEGTKNSLTQKYCVMWKCYGPWEVVIKMRDLKKIPSPHMEPESIGAEGKLTVTYCVDIENDAEFMYKNSKIIPYEVTREQGTMMRYDLSMEQDTEELKLLKMEIMKTLEEKKGQPVEVKNPVEYERWEFENEWIEMYELDKQDIEVEGGLEGLQLNDKPPPLQFTISPEKMIIPKSGLLEITLTPNKELKDFLHYVLISLNSSFFELVGCKTSYGSVTQLYRVMTRFDTWKLQIKMRDLKSSQPPPILPIFPDLSETDRGLPEGRLTILHSHDIIESSLYNEFKSSNLVSMSHNRDKYETWGEKIFDLEMVLEDEKLMRIKKKMMKEWRMTTKKEKVVPIWEKSKTLKWKGFTVENMRKRMELEAKLGPNKPQEVPKGIKSKQMEVVVPETKVKVSKVKNEEEEPEKLLDAQMKTAREEHRLESEEDTMKLIKLSQAMRPATNKKKKKKEEKRAKPKQVWKKRMCPRCVIL